MRSIFISFAISILFSGLFVYLLDSLSPISDEGYAIIEAEFGVDTQKDFIQLIPEIRSAGILLDILNTGNVTAMGIVMWLLAASSFMTLHLFIDKMFFKEFYKSPDLNIALRRSSIFACLALILIGIRISGYWNIPITILIISIGGLIELLFSKGKTITSDKKTLSVPLQDPEIIS
jgi:hypothetical protein